MIVIGLLSLSAAWLFTGCSYTAPWRKTALGHELAASNEKAIVVVTYAKRHKSQRGPFFDNVKQVLADLPNQEGLLGHTFRFQLLGDEAWTITAWRDAAAVRKFSRSSLHAAAVKDSATLAADMKFYTTEREARNLPMPWKEAVTEVSQVTNY